MSDDALEEYIADSETPEAIILLKDQGELSSFTRPTVDISDIGLVRRRIPLFSRNAVPDILNLLGGVHSSIIEARSFAPRPLHLPHLGIIYARLDNECRRALKDNANVDAVLLAPKLTLIKPVSSEIADNPGVGPTWGLDRLGIPDLWTRGFLGQGISVAHLDTGADSRHPALSGAIPTYQVFDSRGHPQSLSGPYLDTGDHGTHTAGTIAGRPLSGGPEIGVAPGAVLMSATVIEDGDVTARVLAGMDWALKSGARVLSMSLGIVGWVASFEQIFQRIRAQELLPVIAIGNEGPHTSRSPGNYPSALSVGAIDQSDQVPHFSSSPRPGGNAVGPTLCAPGVEVLSSSPGGGFQTMRGSSQATPHVAGLAALLWSAKPTATVGQIHDALVASCQNPQNVDLERIGAGIPDGARALSHL